MKNEKGGKAACASIRPGKPGLLGNRQENDELSGG